MAQPAALTEPRMMLRYRPCCSSQHGTGRSPFLERTTTTPVAKGSGRSGGLAVLPKRVRWWRARTQHLRRISNNRDVAVGLGLIAIHKPERGRET